MPRLSRRMAAMAEGNRVSALELFFDLVFVYALTQVTALMAHDGGSAGGIVRGLLVLALLWWCWCCYAWLGNTVRADEGMTRIALFGVMATMFVVALTIPEAFDDLPGGLYAPAVFVVCYLVVRVLHLSVYWQAARGDWGLRRQVLRASVPMLAGASLLTVAAFADTLTGRTVLWAAALGADYVGIFLTGARGWRINSAAHWAERHSLIIIVALGESIVSIGVGVIDEPISWPIIAASALGIAVSAALWWAYFDRLSTAAEHALARLHDVPRAALARDSYTYLHYPMIAGIIVLSFGLKKVFADLGEPLKPIGVYALYGGVVLYLLGQLGFRLRSLGTVGWPRVIAALGLVGLVPVAMQVPALVALALLAVVCVAMVAVESAVPDRARAERVPT